MSKSTHFKSFLLVCVAFSLVACAGPKKTVAVTPDEPTAVDEVSRNRTALAKEKGWDIRKFDLNRDDKADIFKFYGKTGDGDAETMLRKEVDLNHDARIDMVQIFDESGAKTSEHTDLDFDGRTDEIAHYQDGAILRREIDFNYDGRIDITKKYVKGTLTLIESDRTGDGKVDTWEYFENGSIARIGVDKDADGVVDLWEQEKPGAPAAPTEPEAAGEAAPDGTPVETPTSDAAAEAPAAGDEAEAEPAEAE